MVLQVAPRIFFLPRSHFFARHALTSAMPASTLLVCYLGWTVAFALRHGGVWTGRTARKSHYTHTLHFSH